MEEAKVIGVVHLVEPEKAYGAKGFRKRLVVLEQADGRFTNYVPIEFTQERCALAGEIKPGQEVEVTYRLRGRRWDRDGEVKFFVNVEAIAVRQVAGGPGADGESSPRAGHDMGGEDEVPF